MLVIPLTNDYRQTLNIALDGRAVRVTVWWQPNDAWYASVEYPPGTSVVRGRRLTIDQNIMPAHADFPGNIACQRLLETAGDPDANEPWGSTHALVYTP